MRLLIMTKWPKLINFCPPRVGRPINTGNCSRHVLIIYFSLRADARTYRRYGTFTHTVTDCSGQAAVVVKTTTAAAVVVISDCSGQVRL